MSDENKINVSIPKLSILHRLRCQADFDRIIPCGVLHSLYHANVLTCRLVLSKLPDTIGAPIKDGFTIMTRKEDSKIEELKEFLKSVHVNFQDENITKYEDYQQCLMYTIQFKLSPFWNKIGPNNQPYLLNGSYFLTNESNTILATKLDVHISNPKWLTINYIPCILKKTPMELDDILDARELSKFNANPHAFIKLRNSVYAYVIPSLLEVKVVSVLKQIPQDSPFTSYEDLYRHWKNMYGFKLPKDPEGIVYYNVIFQYFPNKSFLYPSVCLFHNKFEERSDSNGTCSYIKKTLLKDLRKSVTQICGIDVDISENDALNDLTESTQASSATPSQSQTQTQIGVFTFDVRDHFKKSQESDEDIPKEEVKLRDKEHSKKIITTYKSLIPDTPRISEYFQSTVKSSAASNYIRGYKAGQEIYKANPISNKKMQKFKDIPKILKPVYSGAEVSRENAK